MQQSRCKFGFDFEPMVEYQEKVFKYIAREDSPRPITYQLELLRRVGFAHVELLHKNSCFAAFGAWKE